MSNEKPNSMRVYLSNKDKNSIEAMAKKSHIPRHMLLSYAVRYFLANYRLGNLRLDPTIEAGKMVLAVDIDLDDGAA